MSVFFGQYDRTAQTNGATRGNGELRHVDEEEPLTPIPTIVEREATISALARQLTQGTLTGRTVDVFAPTRSNDLDPSSPEFDPKKWVRGLSRMIQAEGTMADRRLGLSFRDLSVYGYGSEADYQKTVPNVLLSMAQSARDLVLNRKRKVHILNHIDGVLEAGEMLVVLGPPGSGCTSLLKALSGERNGIYVDENSELNYNGISDKELRSRYRGEAVYTAEVDVHFPKLTVGQTLQFAAEARVPRHLPGGVSPAVFAQHQRDVTMAIYGISHTVNTVVGNDFVRGVSGGERKRVTIAEAALSLAPLQCWDNSTRGLDSANAIDFCKSLRMSSDYFRVSSVVAIYQAPQAAYDVFDKVSVLYDGQQIFFGKTTTAKDYFVRMGWHCPEQQTVPDFLTSLSSASERRPTAGYESRVPNSAEEFAAVWRASPEYMALQEEISSFNQRHPINGPQREEFEQYRRSVKSKSVRAGSPYTLSFMSQVTLNYKRSRWRWLADPSLTATSIVGNFVLALIIGSLYYNLQPTTATFTQRGALLFFAVLLNAFGSALEIVTLYAQRPITEKHDRYAFYHPSSDALATILWDLPFKAAQTISMNLTLYFMSNLRRTPGHFFFFLFDAFLIFMTMTFFFRAIASSSRTLTQALAPSAVLLLALTLYTGYAVPVNYMLGWSRWINYLDPVAYGFEAAMVNEFSGRTFDCSNVVPTGPTYAAIAAANQVCNAIGAVPGSNIVSGEAYINSAYGYEAAHKWRNIGILIAFMFGFLGWHLLTTEYITAAQSKGEVLLFPRGQVPDTSDIKEDIESQNSKSRNQEKDSETPAKSEVAVIERQTAIFSWKDVVYDIKIKNEPRRILDHVDGWVKPGTLTALMGVSGAGKTTLLDVLATRVTMGVVTGKMLVDGNQRDASFQRKTGYVQQQDLHLSTSTVREALRFSALLRQPRHVSVAEKHEYVEEVLRLLEMEPYGDAVVGVPGEGLNVEQRKRLTIGVELAAKPQLLLFLDEPTSGLDSQTSWNILQLLKKLANHGQAILCTIHQPSAMLFENFDRLLFLAKGGRTVYFGQVGAGSHILIDYFVKNGAPPCPRGENPAEWMLTAIGAARGSVTKVDWHQAWLDSPERAAVREELDTMERERISVDSESTNGDAFKEFASSFTVQAHAVLKRAFQQYWRTPSYIWSKFVLCFLCASVSSLMFIAADLYQALFIGFTYFKADNSQQGTQNQLLGVFMILTVFSQLVQQIMPNFTMARSLYEGRERPSKTFSWHVFLISNIFVELPWAFLMGVVMFFCWYYPIGAYQNAVPTDAVTVRGVMVWLFLEQFLLFASTFAFLCVAGMDSSETASNIANLIFSLCLTFCGVLVAGPSMPGFWKFMWRCTPFTYIIEGMITSAVSRTAIVCADNELLRFTPSDGQSCETYMAPYISQAGGYLIDPASIETCQYCTLSTTDQFLEGAFGLEYSHAWRDFGIGWVYIVVNIIGAAFFYWYFRVPKKSKV